MAKLGRFQVSQELLRSALMVPEGTTIVGIRQAKDSTWGGIYEFLVESSDLQDVPEGREIPEHSPIIHVTTTYAREMPPDRLVVERQWEWREL